MAKYEQRALGCAPDRLNGLSERLILSHYQNNYAGAVKRLNLIEEDLRARNFATTPGFVINGLKREQLIATNSMILHELYFECLGTNGVPKGRLAAALDDSFGSLERWRTEFVAMGKALGGGSGWVLLMWLRRDGRLTNQWAADHTHAIADGAPILALDMYEHSYHIDYGANAGAYVDTFMENLDWTRIGARFEALLGTA